jgi:beta-galactosidase
MKAFSGKLVVTVQSIEEAGKMQLEVSGEGLEPATISIQTKQI